MTDHCIFGPLHLLSSFQSCPARRLPLIRGEVSLLRRLAPRYRPNGIIHHFFSMVLETSWQAVASFFSFHLSKILASYQRGDAHIYFLFKTKTEPLTYLEVDQCRLDCRSQAEMHLERFFTRSSKRLMFLCPVKGGCFIKQVSLSSPSANRNHSDAFQVGFCSRLDKGSPP